MLSPFLARIAKGCSLAFAEWHLAIFHGREAQLDLIVGGVDKSFNSGNAHMKIFKQGTQPICLRTRLYWPIASRL